MSAPIVFCDTETDGVHPGRRPWEIALIRREPDGKDTEISFFVKIDLSTADPFGLDVGRFYDRHPAGQRISKGTSITRIPAECAGLYDREEAAQTVAHFTHGAHLVGAVPNFDSEVFDRLLRDHGLCPSWHYHLIDVEALAVGYAAAKGIQVAPPWKSDDLMEAIGVEKPSEEERHTALGDARWCRKTYDAVMVGPDKADSQ